MSFTKNEYKFEHINEQSSPMLAVDETVYDISDAHKKRISDYKLRQNLKSPFQIGSIDDINTRICHLGNQLASVCRTRRESQSSTPDCLQMSPDFMDYGEDLLSKSTTKLSDYYQEMQRTSGHINEIPKTTVREKKQQLTAFAGLYSIQSTLAFNKTERVKKIASIGLKSDSKSLLAASSNNRNSEERIPKYIELCQYRGFNRAKFTDLPHEVDVSMIVDKVIAAQRKYYTMMYKKFFIKGLSNEYVCNMILDMFWYLFIEVYGMEADKIDQAKYFHRTSSTFVSLLIFLNEMENQRFQNRFLDDLPQILSQLIYTAICECFPDSMNQFDNKFKEKIIRMVYLWIIGTKPQIGSHLQWNLEKLKPSEVLEREEQIRRQIGRAKNNKTTSPTNFNENLKSSERSVIGTNQDKTEVNQSNLKSSSNSETLNLFEQKKILKKSSLIGRESQTSRVCFNVCGKSPLIHFYLRSKGLYRDAGTDNLLGRLEFESLNLPAINSGQTYHDLLKKSRKTLSIISTAYQRSYQLDQRLSMEFQKRITENSRKMDRLHKKLLSNKKRVHDLSTVLVLDHLKNQDSQSFGADRIIENSLKLSESIPE